MFYLSKIWRPKIKTSMSSVAFIMDGNRRYSRKLNISDIDAKTVGFKKMLEICEYCRFLGLKEASFFAFSLANFKRDKSEVDGIMNLIKSKKDELHKVKTKINIYGRSDMIEQEIREIFKEIQDNYIDDEFKINIFFAYSSMDDIDTLSYKESVDLLVRTSGEKRLSDFMLYQCANGTSIFFCNSLWPRFSVLQLWLIIYKCEMEKLFFEKEIKFE